MSACRKYDVLIVGGGNVGLTLALALIKSSTLSVAVMEAGNHDAVFTPEQYHHRVSAMTLASVRILQSLAVWPALISKRVSPFTRIQVWNSGKWAQALHFDCADIHAPQLGFIIENNVLQAALKETLARYANVHFIDERAVSFVEDAEGVTLTTLQGTVLHAPVAVAADGAHSWLRQAAGIDVIKHDYQETALVATINTTAVHAHVARQCFLPTGPLGILPLAQPNLSSIVWSLPQVAAQRLLALDADAFKSALTMALDGCLGDVIALDARFIFPLKKQQACAYVKSRVVLVGDAAHVVHPLAGQGVNMGLMDAACLAEVLLTAWQAQSDMAARKLLRRYERWRRADNDLMIQGIDVIKAVFSQQTPWLTTVATLGMSAMNQLSLVKNMLARHAVGHHAYLPAMARHTVL